MEQAKRQEPPGSASISAVIPTLNEEDNLRFLLPTLAWCDEVILVDQGSRDRTIDTGRELGARIVETEWQPAFDACRALGAEHARGDWIFTLDADEMVPRRLADRLLEIVAADEVDVVGIARLNYFHGPLPAAGLWPDTQFRFFRRGAVSLDGRVHDFVKLHSQRVLRLPDDEELALHHFSYRSAFHQLDKLNRYTELEQRKPSTATSTARALLWTPLRAFLGRFVGRGGIRYGWRGFWHASFWAIYFFVSAIKRWEADALPAARSEEDRARRRLLEGWKRP